MLTGVDIRRCYQEGLLGIFQFCASARSPVSKSRKMLKLFLFLCVVFLIDVGQACDESDDEQLAAAREQESVEYLTNAYGFAPNWLGSYYQLRIPEYANVYEGRTTNRQQPTINPFRNYLNKNNAAAENAAESRFGISQLGTTILNAGLFNNRFTASGITLNRPFAGLGNRLPISFNPKFASPISAFDSCTAPSGEAGICSPGAVCSLFGGRPSGSCLLGGVCCINAITTCGGTVTLNNTYWQSPTTAVSAPSTCALTVKLNTALVEQKKPICQVRLDFVSFSIGGTDKTTLGACTDTFQVGGVVNSPPIICGDNNGQHMYLEVPSSATNPTDVQLMLNFAAGTTTTRSWNIKIAMLPCGTSYLAPSNCLQYFTSGSGTVSSFNWKDVAEQRQLNNQNYNICFRTELVNSQTASNLCLSPCSTATRPFIMGAGLNAVGVANVGFGNSGTALATGGISTGCLNDFIIFIGGSAGTNPTVSADRFCGERLDPNNPSITSAASVTSLCSTFKPFKLLYKTDNSEDTTATPPLQYSIQLPMLDFVLPSRSRRFEGFTTTLFLLDELNNNTI